MPYHAYRDEQSYKNFLKDYEQIKILLEYSGEKILDDYVDDRGIKKYPNVLKKS